MNLSGTESDEETVADLTETLDKSYFFNLRMLSFSLEEHDKLGMNIHE